MKTKTKQVSRGKFEIFLFLYLFLIFFIFSGVEAFSQSVGIGESTFTPDPSAILDVRSTTQGAAIPRMTTTQMNAIASPLIGLIIFNTDCNTINYYNGTSWVALGNTGTVSTPGTITGNTTPCQNATGIAYSIAAVSGATGYNWVVPSGATVTTGQGTTNITVNFGTVNGNVCVTAYNTCGSSTANCVSITLSPSPSSAGSISGTSGVCQGQNGVVYSVSAISGATGYVWAYTGTGFSIASGSNTNSITANFSGSATSGDLTVYGTHVCGNGTPSSAYAVTVNIPPTTASAGSDINPSCGVTTATLAGNTPGVGTGAWSVVSGTATITTPSSPTSGVTGLAVSGTVTLRWTISNSICTPSTDDVVITTQACCTPSGPVLSGTLQKTTTCDGLYTIVSFTYSSSPGSTTWTCPSGVSQVQYLVVGGGASGGAYYYGGGGGSGAFNTATGYSVTPGSSYTVAVGAGGAAQSANNSSGNSGGTSKFATITSSGGSGGLSRGGSTGGTIATGSAGGGGGGGGEGGCGTYPPGAGGGGAGSAGQSSSTPCANPAGNGGTGLSSNITGSTVWYAAGGGGGNLNNLDTGGLGGSGIGGNGAYNPGPRQATAGSPNTGSGGGGASHANTTTSGAGSSGIVIIRYLTP